MNMKQLLYLINNNVSEKNTKQKKTKTKSTSLSSKEYVEFRKNKNDNKK